MSRSTIYMSAPPEVFCDRRKRIAATLHRPLVLFAGHAPARNYTGNPHHFRPGSTYLYFGGPPLEHAALVIEPNSDGASGCTFFRPPAGEDDALWIGQQAGDSDLAQAAGLPATSLRDLDQLATAIKPGTAAAIIPPFPDTIAHAARLGIEAANEEELLAIIDLRLYKDKHELKAMRQSAEVCMQGQRAAMAATRPGVREADVAAAFHSVLIAHEYGISFEPIITVRGEVLHGHGHPNVIQAGELLLCDSGAEDHGFYASDITRTWPVSGEWTPIQRHLYQTVARSLSEATALCKPGVRYRDVHDHAAKVICEGLVEAELLRGDPNDLFARRAHTPFFPHGVGHLIGLDAHDMEDFGDLAGYPAGRNRRPEFGNCYVRLDRDLAPGMCVTVEPGIYFVPAIWQSDAIVGPLADVVNRAKVDALLADNFGGIRLEHTVCVRSEDAGGPEVLSAPLTTDADEACTLVGTAR